MAIAYHIYANDGRGGEVDYSAPVATTSDLSFAAGPLLAPSDNWFAVRALDTASGIEEANTDARVRLLIDPAGNDVTAQPNPANGLSARRTAGGTCRLAWGYDSTGQGGAPSRFDVTMNPGPTGPVASVAYLAGVSGYECTVSGLAPNISYAISVRAVGASSVLTSVASTVLIDYLVSALNGVDSLAAVPSP